MRAGAAETSKLLSEVASDYSRNLTTNRRDRFREWTEAWARGFSDGRIVDPKYIDAGDAVVTHFTVEGTKAGEFGSLLATHKRISVPFCEVCQLDKWWAIGELRPFQCRQ